MVSARLHVIIGCFSLILAVAVYYGMASAGLVSVHKSVSVAESLPVAKSPGKELPASKEEIRLHLALKEVLGSRGNPAWVKHLEGVEVAIWQTYQSLPKTAQGRLGVRAARYIIQRHLANQHGWLVKGIEPHGFRRSISKALPEVGILAEKAPELARALSDARPAERGFTFGDIVTIFAAIERLFLDDALLLLRSAYNINNRTLDAELNDKAAQEVLMSYVIMMLGGSKMMSYDRKMHLQDKQNRSKHNSPAATGWKEMVMFQRDVWQNHLYEYRRSVNPFVSRKLSYAAAQHVSQEIAMRFGRWQDAECRQIKADLIKLDKHALGRVPLGLFYRQPTQFSENTDYLRAVGALDETLQKMPMVIIPNYLQAPCNCIATFKHRAVCCMNECEPLMAEIESIVRAPSASAKQLLTIIANNITSAYVDAPRHLPQMLVDKMQDIEAHHQGFIPIHGRLFQQWLHFAFPRDCPYPQIAKTAAVLTRDYYSQGSFIAALKDMQWHARVVGDAKNVKSPFMSQWSDVEVLPIHEQDVKHTLRNVYSSGVVVNYPIWILALVCLLFSTWFIMRGGLSLPQRQLHQKREKEREKEAKAKGTSSCCGCRRIPPAGKSANGIVPPAGFFGAIGWFARMRPQDVLRSQGSGQSPSSARSSSMEAMSR